MNKLKLFSLISAIGSTIILLIVLLCPSMVNEYKILFYIICGLTGYSTGKVINLMLKK